MLAKVILLVDDEALVRTLANRVLSRAGYRVIEAADGEAAFALLRRPGLRVDLLLTDVVMPRMDGLELAGRLTSLQPGTPVLCMSGNCEADVVSRDILRRGFAFIPKPFRMSDLERKVAEALELKPHGLVRDCLLRPATPLSSD